ncbi:hypothetical protein M8J77_006439 [Diaphorina citri]|nr:hypothetical protein M8J77_006439 [Diaphorina citri]
MLKTAKNDRFIVSQVLRNCFATALEACQELQDEINYDSPRGGVSVITEKGDVTTSYLLIQRASQGDSGNYTCNPSNANAKTVHVHVLNGEVPAAMQRACPSHFVHPVYLIAILCLTLMSR